MLYIHQYPDWTSFRYNFQSVMDALGQTRLQEGKLLGIFDVVNSGSADTETLATDIWANFAIDSETAFAKPTDDLKGLEKIQSEISKKNDATPKIKNILGALLNASQPLTAERLFAWHAAVGQNKVKQFRTKDSAWGVSADRIEHEMNRFLQWFETSKTDGAVKAAIAQFWFLTIRPFDDGNGIIARTLSIMLLARSEGTSHCQYSLNKQILEGRQQYFDILAKAQQGNGDLTQWILWFLNILKKSIEESLQNYTQALQNLRFLQKFKETDFTSRERELINAIRSGKLPKPFSAKDAAALTGVSHDSALRDIQSLIQKGILKAENKGGRSQKYSTLIQ
ncbi:MAG: DUF4172 domain-containing protein [Fibrobacter sp.]|nr:DUF4172 domain-containing protein [Fibrobacter sp.]